MSDVDYYEILGIGRAASESEIKSAYRSLARTMHPDVGGTPGTFRLLQQAYETLSDPRRRASYDAERDTPTPTRRGSRRQAPSRREFGDDPHFVAELPRLTPNDLHWWKSVDPAQAVRYIPTTGPDREPMLAMLGGWVLLLFAGLAAGLTAQLLAIWLTLVVVGGVVVVVVLRRYLESQRQNRLFRADFGNQKVFGDGEPEPPQALTAELVRLYLTRLPGVRIFHNLALPGSVLVDVDHAVLCGRRLVLVESKRWLPGHYTSSDDGLLWRNGHRFRGGSTRLPGAIAAFEEVLPELSVCGAVVMYPSRAGEITADDPAELLMTPEQFVREIGAWLACEAAVVDRDAVAYLVERVVAA